MRAITDKTYVQRLKISLLAGVHPVTFFRRRVLEYAVICGMNVIWGS